MPRWDQYDGPAPTLEHFVKHGLTHAICSCSRRGHEAVVPLAMLIERLGAGHAFPAVRVRCSQCGTRGGIRPGWTRGLSSRGTENLGKGVWGATEQPTDLSGSPNRPLIQTKI